MNRWLMRIGLLLILSAILLPVATHLGIRIWHSHLWAREHAPNQAAMLAAGIYTLLSIALAIVMALTGLFFLAIGWMRDN